MTEQENHRCSLLVFWVSDNTNETNAYKVNLPPYSIEVVDVSSFLPLWEHLISTLLQGAALYKVAAEQNVGHGISIKLSPHFISFRLDF